MGMEAVEVGCRVPPRGNPAPLCVTGAGCTAEKAVEGRAWSVECDKLRLFFVHEQGPEVLDALCVNGNRIGDVQPGRMRGRRSSRVRAGKVGGFGGEPIFALWRKFDDPHLPELEVEVNPRLQGEAGLAYLGMWLRDVVRVDPAKGQVVRCDVCHDLAGVDRRMFRLDPGRHSLTQDVRSTGLHGEWAGYGSKRKVRLYNKQAERIAAGAEDPGALMRFELEAYGPYNRVDRAGAEPELMRLADLGQLAWPVCEGWGVREFVHVPDDFMDPRYGLLVAAAMTLGSRFAESQARQLLGWRAQETVRACYWPEVEPSPLVAFERQWAGVSARLLSAMAA